MNHPAHLAAKAAQDRWLDGYQVVISHVLRTYGDGKLQGLLPTTGLFTLDVMPQKEALRTSHDFKN